MEDCKFINVVRDGRDVISSIISHKFWPIAKQKEHSLSSNIGGEFTVENAARYWSNLTQLAIEKRSIIGPEHWLDVRFEDIVTKPEETWRTVLTFLSEEFDEAVMDRASEIIKGKPKGKLQWDRAAHLGRWQEDLSTYDLLIIQGIASKQLEHFGYKMMTVGSSQS
jgi:hypothetical protein